ncbi:hypothetical protein SO802_019333 [Lithocarpus litseifolius]|uniref:DDE Tnp4 domain-containing protein n=1 Tax=Lithocarpus litseifolius TaxID=425828 RepID=A0AAW2CRU9_9ROSI
MELFMDGDYRNYCDDHDGGALNDGNYNNADNNNYGDNNDDDDDDDESSDSDDDSDSNSDDDDSNDVSDEEFYQLMAVTCEASVTYFNKYINKTPCYDSEQTWWAWVRRCMEGNEKLCYNMFRMKNEDCIGAIDGTHVIAVVPTDKSIPYFGRKGYPTQNVMAACDFDMLFTFVLPRWDGSGHNTSIFLDTIRKQSNNFPNPPTGKYYVVDFGYPIMKGSLAP